MNNIILSRKKALNEISKKRSSTKFYFDVPSGGGEITFRLTTIDKPGTFVCEWGDGTITEMATTTTSAIFLKTYEQEGKYTAVLYSKDGQLGVLTAGTKVASRTNFINWIYKLDIGEPCSKISNLFGVTSSHASKLTEIIVRENVTNIAARSFLACQSIKKITLPFTGISNIQTGIASYFGAIFGYSNTTVLEAVPTDKIIQYQTTNASTGVITYYYYNIPTTLETVIITGKNGIKNAEAFKECSFKELIIYSARPSSNLGLKGIKGINNLTIPSIGPSIPSSSSSDLVYYAFGSFFGETTEDDGVKQNDKYMAIPKSLKNLVITGNLKGLLGTAGVPHYAFQNCDFLENVYYTNNVQWIGRHAFRNCANLKTIKIGNGVEKIFKGAFTGCTQLTSIKLPHNLKDIEAGTFGGCPNLEYINTNDNPYFIYEDGILYSKDKSAIYYCSEKAKITELIIPETINKIMNYSMYNNYLEKIFVKTNIEITDLMFRSYDKTQEYCKNIKTLEVEGKSIQVRALNDLPIETFIINEGTYFHMFGSLSGVKTLKRVIDRRKIASYSSNFFNGCEKLESIDFLKMDSIPEYGFKGCISLKGEISLPNVYSISRCGFEGCTGITSLNLSNNTKLTKIGYDAFYGCTNLSGTLYFPPSLQEVGSIAFGKTGGENGYDHIIYDCIYCRQYSDYPFAGVKINKITIGENVETITSFFRKALFSQIAIPENVVTIDSFAFADCVELEEINIKGKTIINLAFDNTKYYNTEENWDKNLLYLKGEKATFLIGVRNKEQIEAVYLPDDVIYLPINAFYNSENLKRLAFGENFERIGSSALGSTEITDFYFPKKMSPTQKIDNSNYDKYFGYWSDRFKRIFFQGSEEEWPIFLANLQKVWTWNFMAGNENIYYNCEIALEDSVSVQGKIYLEGVDTYRCLKDGYVGLPSTDITKEYFEKIEEEVANVSEEN